LKTTKEEVKGDTIQVSQKEPRPTHKFVHNLTNYLLVTGIDQTWLGDYIKVVS